MEDLEMPIKMEKTIFTDEFSKEIYEQTYKYGKEDINQTFYRVAKNIASIENDKETWTEKFYEVLTNFNFSPGGRITSNAGTGLKGTTLINCFVDGFMGSDQDSMEGILSALRRQALILKSEGGYGFCADVMRPRGAFINGIGNESPGAVRMLDMWDTQSAVITEGSGKKVKKEKAKNKIRKGAQMVTMSCWHPDIEEFITAKQTSGRLTKFNMSVLVTDDLMHAVENNLSWDLIFPDYDVNPTEYKNEWDGNIKKWIDLGYATKVYKTYKNANEVYDIIMESTYKRNEPGVLFVDVMNRLNNLYYNEFINATNPCGEQILPIGGVCLLGSINLTQFVDLKNNDWDYKKLEKLIPSIVRFMDNVNDVTYVPLPSQTENLLNKRRIGLGVLGYGSALLMMKLRYGSEKALQLTDKLEEFICNHAYMASALIAKEKGVFPLYDEKKYLSSEFVKMALWPKTIELIKKYGMRNSHILSIQPTGNTSIFANNVSGGFEPIFLPEYVRTSIMPYAPEGLNKPKNINWEQKTFEVDGDTKWTWKKEGDESILKTEFDGYTWKFDKSRGLLRETLVQDYGVRYLSSIGEWDPNADWAATTTQLTIKEHVDTMTTFAKYIDSAMSKTINLPANYPYEDFKKLYYDLFKTGIIKGGTTYREGTMATVLAAKEDKKDQDDTLGRIIKNDAPPRPLSLPCEINHIQVQGDKWIVLVGLYEGDPYETFAFKTKNINLSPKWKNGVLTKVKKGHYSLIIGDGDIEIANVGELFETDEQEALTRLVSLALRHGAGADFIYEQLSKSKGSIVSFSKAIGRTLKKYLSEGDVELKETMDGCNSDGKDCKIVREEGCLRCLSCGVSKCM